MLLAACLLLLPLSATAAVRYEFTAFSSIDDPDTEEVESYSGGFVLEVPDFIVPRVYPESTAFAPDSLLSCSVLNNGVGAGPCGYQEFFKFDGYSAGDVIGFGVNAGRTFYYYFITGAFSQFGTYSSMLLGDSQRGRLVVSRSRDQGTTIPEPGTLAVLGLAVAGLGLARRRTQ